MHSVPAFHAHGISHLGALTVIGLVGVGLIAQARRSPGGPLTLFCERGFALVLLALPFGKLAVQLIKGTFDLQGALPFHYCDLAAIIGAAALLTHRQWFCEITYFFGLAGTLQALITPSLLVDFPDHRFWLFFGGHGAVVITAFYVVFGLRHPPQAGAVTRAMIIMSIYAITVSVLNALLGTNYGFLCAKPPTASLMDYLGPWPWYVGSLWLLGLVFYLVLNLPFVLQRRRAARS